MKYEIKLTKDDIKRLEEGTELVVMIQIKKKKHITWKLRFEEKEECQEITWGGEVFNWSYINFTNTFNLSQQQCKGIFGNEENQPIGCW